MSDFTPIEPLTSVDPLTPLDEESSNEQQPKKKPYLKFKNKIKTHLILELCITCCAFVVTLLMFFVPMYVAGIVPFSSFDDTLAQIQSVSGSSAYYSVMGFVTLLFVIIQVVYCIVYFVKCILKLNKLEQTAMLTYHSITKGDGKKSIFSARKISTGSLVAQSIFPMMFGVVYYLVLMALKSSGIVLTMFQLITGVTVFGYVIAILWIGLVVFQIIKASRYKKLKTEIIQSSYDQTSDAQPQA